MHLEVILGFSSQNLNPCTKRMSDGSTNTKNPKLPLKVILNDNLNKNYDLIGYG